ncbi:unnamed protein product, partial [Meganyctiphanes norvegica]
RTMWRDVIIAILITVTKAATDDNVPCQSRDVGGESVVCVCDSSVCDTLSRPEALEPGSYLMYTSSKDGLRFSKSSGSAEEQPTGNQVIEVNHDNEYQTILGFGGAFTDSTGLNVAALSSSTQDYFIRSYFGGDSIEYNLCRVPIAGSDCSTRPYSYDDTEGDVVLEKFALQDEDYNYKLPLILAANSLSESEVKLFGSPWSPPSWMKTNGKFNESGELIKEMWQPYSNYLVKFVEAYEAQGVPLWGLTTQNEPLSGFEVDWEWNTCGWSAEDMRDWVKGNLGPTLVSAGLGGLIIMVDDYNRPTLPEYPAVSLNDSEASAYIDGVAVHWYSDNRPGDQTGPEVLDQTHELFPDKFILYTEACAGYGGDPTGKGPILGSWQRAENYATNIIEDINHHSTGWVDWNMALDLEGGPNWAGNMLDAPILINKESDEFYKQPTFYAMGHFSKFVKPGSTRIDALSDDSDLWVAAFQQIDQDDVFVVTNVSEEEKLVTLSDSDKYINLNLKPRSINTIIYKGDH